MEKRCTKCGEVKPVEEFYKYNRRTSYREECKACTKKKNDEWKSKNPDYMKNYLKAYHNENSKKIIARSVRWGRENINRRRDISRESAKKQRDFLNDAYVKLCLKRRLFNPETMTPELIAAERVLIKIKRAVKEIENEKTERNDDQRLRD